MVPTFSINMEKRDKRTLRRIGELLKDVNNNDLTREWAGEAFLKLRDDLTVVDLTKYALACEKNHKISKKKKNLKEQSIITQDEVEKGYSGVVDIVSDKAENIIDEVILDIDLDFYVNYFLEIRKRIFYENGQDIWRLLTLSKQEDVPAQRRLKLLMNDSYVKKFEEDSDTSFRDVLYYVLTKGKCYSILEGLLC